MFNKSNINFTIDALMFLCMAALGGIGLLMKYILLSGQEAQLKYGAKVELFFLGQGKHEWGNIHLIIGCVLVGLLILHIYLHWTQTVIMYRKLIGSQLTRRVVLVVFVIVCILLLILPFIIEPGLEEKAGGSRRGEYSSLEYEEKAIQYSKTAPNIPDYSLYNATILPVVNC